MRTMTVVAIATLLAAAPASGQNAPAIGTAPAKAATVAPATTTPVTHAAPIRPAAASTPESRSAAALALSHEPTFDEGTAQRIKEAALSYYKGKNNEKWDIRKKLHPQLFDLWTSHPAPMTGVAHHSAK